MPVQVPFRRVIQSMIISLAVFAILLIWPFNVWAGYSRVGEINPDSKSIVQPEGIIFQSFIPVTEDLSYISFYIYNEDAYFPGGRLVVRLFDAEGKLEEREYGVEDLKIPGLCRIPVTTKLNTEKGYYFTIENPDAELLYAMEDGVNIDMQFLYKADHLTWQGVGRIVLIIVIAAALCLSAEFLLRGVQGSFRFDLGFRFAVGLVISAVCFWFLWNVFPARKFTTDTFNIVVLEAGILLFAAYCLYGLLHKREEQSKNEISWKEITAKLPGVLQTLAFAGVMTGGVNYLNALRFEEQKIGANLVYCSFALAIICTFTKKELINWYNLVYTVIAVPAGIFYCLPYKEEVWQWDIAKGNAWCVALWGVILCNIIRLLILERKPRYRISGIYTLVVVLLLASMIMNRNKRTWPIEAAVFFGLFAIRLLYKGDRNLYLRNFRNGIFLHFLWISGYAFLYRPFHFFMWVRYGGVFHTVTMAAVYDCLVLVLATGNLLIKYAKGKSLSCLWKEIGMVGITAGFLFLTASKTGIYAAVILILLLLVVTVFTAFQDKLVGLLKRLGILCLTAATFIVIVFSACRLVPAVVSEPFTYDIERFSESIVAGDAWDSYRFVTVQKFLALFVTRFRTYDEADITIEIAVLGARADYSNGRQYLFKSYFHELDWKGHEGEDLPESSGERAGHAHNVYLQMAYDFGIAAGILFLGLCIFAGIRSILYYLRHKEEETSVLPVLALGVYGICGLAEWVLLPCISTGFAFFFVMALMIPKEEKKQEG